MVLFFSLACEPATTGPKPDSGRPAGDDTGTIDRDSGGDTGATGGDCGRAEVGLGDANPLGAEYAALPVYIAGGNRRFATIQDAIWGAETGDRVVVTPGTYMGTVDFHGKVITLCSEQGPWVTVLDAQGVDTVVRLRNWEPAETVLQGFTITGGVGEGDEFWPNPHGGGVFVEWGSPTIRHNVVVRNAAHIGAGIYVRNGAPTVENNIVAWNYAAQGGGGITCTACRGRIAYNTFYENNGAGGPLAEYFWGAADFVGNLAVVQQDQPAIRWMEPRPDVEWTGGPNVVWPAVQWLDSADDADWPEFDRLQFADPLLSPGEGVTPEAWQVGEGSSAVDAGPDGELDPDGSPADCGAFGGPEGSGW